jgi:hypothetical protein
VLAVHDAGGSKCRQYMTKEAASAGSMTQEAASAGSTWQRRQQVQAA